MFHDTLQAGTFKSPSPTLTVKKLTVHPLGNRHREEVLAYLAVRPLHTAYMAGCIRDNGIISPLHRGSFVACRNARNQLEGVALIGHATLIETESDAALAAFARLAHDCPTAHVLLGEQDKIDRFWNYYSQGGQSPRLMCREMLLEQRRMPEDHEAVHGLRLATLDDLQLVLPVQAAMAFEESGVNPMERDPQGFRERVARRIKRGRIYVWVEDGRLMFKADVMTETPQAMYLEGVYVNPQERGQGYGLRCLNHLGRTLLARVESITLLVNTQNPQALSLYLKAGYEQRGYYHTIFLRQKSN